MSRTYKDRPVRVRLRENYERGRIDHDHRPSIQRERRGYFVTRDLSLVFPKSATAEIEAHRRYLDSLTDITYEVVEEGPTRIFDRADPYEPVRWAPRTVEFHVYTLYAHPGHSGECTAHLFDPADPQAQRCSPKWTNDVWPRRRARRSEASKTQVRSELEHLRGLANSGELDEAYSSATLEERYGPKVWTWDD